MNKSKIIIGAIAAVLLLAAGVFALRNASNSGGPTQVSNQLGTGDQKGTVPLPSFTPDQNKIVDNTGKLTGPQRTQLAAFAGNIAGLYLSYSYGDVNNIYALTDYATANGANVITAYAQNLENTIPSGYAQHAVVDNDRPMRLTFDSATKRFSLSVETKIYNVSIPGKPKESGRKGVFLDLERGQAGEWRINSIQVFDL